MSTIAKAVMAAITTPPLFLGVIIGIIGRSLFAGYLVGQDLTGNYAKNMTSKTKAKP